jgi:ribosome-associated heat shock protein Hsp15
MEQGRKPSEDDIEIWNDFMRKRGCSETDLMRLDKWLWAVRLFKTRSLAIAACRGGHVKVAGVNAKPAHEVHPGEIIVVRAGERTRTLKVLGAPESRIAARLVPQFAEDLTPPADLAPKPPLLLPPPVFRPKGAGRPTKRERRALDQLGLGGE